MKQIERILVISNSKPFLERLKKCFSDFSELKNTFLEQKNKFEDALLELSVGNFDFILIDARKQKQSALEMCLKLAAVTITIPFIMINNPGHESQAISCLKSGANDYILANTNWNEQIPYSIIHSIESKEIQTRHKSEFYRLKKELHELSKQLKQNDSMLKSLYTKEQLPILLENELHRSVRHGFDISLLSLNLLDSNNLSLENEIRETISNIIRKGDYWTQTKPGNYTAILTHTNKAQAKDTAERIFQQLATQFKMPRKNIKIKTITKSAKPSSIDVSKLITEYT